MSFGRNGEQTIEQRIDAEYEHARRHDELAVEAAGALAALPGRQADGELDPDTAERELDEIEAKHRRHVAMAQHHRRVAEQLEERLSAEDAREARRQAAQARDALGAKLEKANAAATALANALTTARNAAARLVEARAAADEAEAHARELARVAEVEFDLPELADEPALPIDLDQLFEVVKSGPRQPLADEQAAIEADERKLRVAEETLYRQAVEDALRGRGRFRLDRLSPERRAQAEQEIAERLAEQRPPRAAAVAGG